MARKDKTGNRKTREERMVRIVPFFISFDCDIGDRTSKIIGHRHTYVHSK